MARAADLAKAVEQHRVDTAQKYTHGIYNTMPGRDPTDDGPLCLCQHACGFADEAADGIAVDVLGLYRCRVGGVKMPAISKHCGLNAVTGCQQQIKTRLV